LYKRNAEGAEIAEGEFSFGFSALLASSAFIVIGSHQSERSRNVRSIAAATRSRENS
jgi:hypothetical protein